MQIRVNKTFLKELAVLPLKERIRIERFLFEKTKNIKNLYDIPNLGKLKGYKNYYKIRFGNYRVGLKYEANTLTFERLLHRKDIYKYYP